jgi:hypothetical protein
MRSVETIKNEIKGLQIELQQALERQRQLKHIEREQVADNKSVIEKLNKDWSVVVTNTGQWWCDENGFLIWPCNSKEMDAMRRLKNAGFIESINSFQ